jgi:hypothetical protein
MHEGRCSWANQSSIVVTVGKSVARMTTWRRTSDRNQYIIRDLLEDSSYAL